MPELEENEPGAPPTSLREKMEQHRANPVCSACHAPMDPLGFVLENFDAIGRWRDTDDGAPIDSTVAMTDGRTMRGPEELGAHLTDRQDEVLLTLTEKLLSYALGRSLAYYDAPTVRQLIRDAAVDDYRWSSFVHGIVNSLPFQMRRVPPTQESTASTAQ